MRLVLSIFDSQHATVVSDGRSVHLNEAGNPEIVRNDSRKVFRTKSDQVFALTGQVNLCDPLKNELVSFQGTLDEVISAEGLAGKSSASRRQLRSTEPSRRTAEPISTNTRPDS